MAGGREQRLELAQGFHDHVEEAVLAVIFLLLGSSLEAADYTGRVVGVIDGDTIEVLHQTPCVSASDVAHIDLTPCILELNPADRLTPSGTHYSPQANAAIANCLYEGVNEALAVPTSES